MHAHYLYRHGIPHVRSLAPYLFLSLSFSLLKRNSDAAVAQRWINKSNESVTRASALVEESSELSGAHVRARAWGITNRFFQRA